MNDRTLIPVPQRILVRGVNWLGDAVMTTPALARLRQAFPAACITLLTPAKLAGLWQGHPALDRVVEFGRRESSWRVAWRLRRERFDLAIVFPNSPRSAWEVWLAGAVRRVGYAARGRRWLLTHPWPPRPGYVAMRKRPLSEIHRRVATCEPPSRPGPDMQISGLGAHHLHQYLHLAGAVGADAAPLAPQLFVTEAEVEAIARRFGLAHGPEARVPILGLNPGAEFGPAKRWPADRFIEVAVAVQRLARCRWLILGGPAEVPLAERLAAAIEQALSAAGHPKAGEPVERAVVNVAGRTSLRELCAVLKACRLLLTNDTGPMHLAAAVGTPVVALFGSTAPELTGPGLPGDTRHRVLRVATPCAPCFRRECPIDFRCMTGIAVGDVARSVCGALGFANPG